MSCIKVPALQNDLPSPQMDICGNLLESESKYKELITAANKVFGKEWSHAVTNTTIDFIDFNLGKYQVGCQATVKVQLSNGRYHEDVGYNSIDASAKGLAVETARSISITNALKKALSCFTEMEGAVKPQISNQNSASNISNIIKTKFASKRPITPPPPAQSTPKVPRSPASFDKIHGKPLTPVALVTNNGLKVPEEKDRMDISVEYVDLDIIFDKSNNVPDASSLNVPTTSSNATTLATLTEEDIRLERKRKQREKQEEFKRQMKEKEERDRQNQRLNVQKPSSKF